MSVGSIGQVVTKIFTGPGGVNLLEARQTLTQRAHHSQTRAAAARDDAHMMLDPRGIQRRSMVL